MKKGFFFLLGCLIISLSICVGVYAQFPVPREQAVVIETDTNFTNFSKTNPWIPGAAQWGSGYHQVAIEYDWYINYATGETIYWRTIGWEYSDDQLQMTWHVRPGVTWNDGEAYTAHDIAFSYELMMQDGFAPNVTSVRALDDYTALFTFDQPEYRFHHKFRMWGGRVIRPQHVWQDVDVWEFDNFPPVETGPYKLFNVYPDLKMFVWERDENYWAQDVWGVTLEAKYVINRVSPPPDLDLAEFIKGNVDVPLPHIFTINMIWSAQKQTDHVVTAPFMDLVSQGITFNTALYPTSMPEFRWALQHLIDRDKLATFYPPAERSFPTMWPWPDYASLDKFESEEIAEKYGSRLRYDPEEAERILDELGFQRGSDGFRRTPEGEEISLTLLTHSMPDLGFFHASDFSDELKDVGIRSFVRAVGAGVFHTLTAMGSYSLTFDVLSPAPAFPSDIWIMFDLYHSRHALPLGETQTTGDRASSRFQSPELDAITEQMAHIPLDTPEYFELAKRGLEIWYENLPSVPSIEKIFIQTFSDRYWTGWPTAENMYHVPYPWWPEFIFVLFELEQAG